MVLQPNLVDPAEDDEFIYIKDEKRDEDEMELLTPVLLNSMFDLDSPPDLYRVVKDVDKPDDATEATAESMSDLMLPTFDTPPRVRSNESSNDLSDISLDSYGNGEAPSPRNVISPGLVINYPLRIPSDVRYEGQVTFSVPRGAERRIRLQPRASALTDSIFVAKMTTPYIFSNYGDFALADSLSTFGGDNNGAEECKCDDEYVSKSDEGFAYVYAGERYKEDDYWGEYDGHYGSCDAADDRVQHDYAEDHASVKGESVQLSSPSTHYQEFPSARASNIVDDLQDMFAACFSCSNSWSTSREQPSPALQTARTTGYFSPADYGVST